MYLIVTREGSPLHVMPMSDGVLAVGRDARNGLTLDDQALSPRQVEIQVRGGLATVNSVAGTPGFEYQGKPHYQVVLPEGHEVKVGPYALRVETAPPPSSNLPGASGPSAPTLEGEGVGVASGASNGSASGVDWDEDLFGAALGDLFEEDEEGAMNSGAAVGWDPESDSVAMPWSAEDIAKAQPLAGDHRREDPSPTEGFPALGGVAEAALEASLPEEDSLPEEESLAEAMGAIGGQPEDEGLSMPEVGIDINQDIHTAETQPLKRFELTLPEEGDDEGEAATQRIDGAAFAAALVASKDQKAEPEEDSGPEVAGASPQAAPWDDAEAIEGPHLLPKGDVALAPLRLEDGTAFIGSAEGMDLVLKDPTVARRHGALIYKDEVVRIQDMTGNRTIQVNGVGIQSKALRNGDRIRVGLTELRFVWADQPELPLDDGQRDQGEPDAYEGPKARGSKGMVVGLVALAGLIGLGISVGPQLLGPESSEVTQNPTPDPAQVRVARALLNGGRYASAEDVIAGMPQDSGEAVALRRRGEEARAADDIAFALWLETVGEANSKKDWAGVRRAEGADYLARAEGAFGRGAPPEIVGFWIEQSRLAFEDAKRLQPRSEETEAGLEAARRLRGRLEVQGDSLAQRLKSERLNLLLERGKTEAEAGQAIEAARTLGHVVSRGEAEGQDAEFMAEANRALQGALAAESEALTPLYEGAKVAIGGGRLMDAKALYEGVLWLKPGDPVATQALTELKPALLDMGKRILAEGEAALKANNSEAARQKLRQVLGYVPDRSEAIHREALKKLEAMAGAP